jgi:DNA-binding protein WhiA
MTQITLEQIKAEISHPQPRKNVGGGDGFDQTMRELLLSASGSFAHGYHIELGFDDIDVAREFAEELAVREILAHVCRGRVYIKDSQSICNLLALVGANKSLCDLHNLIVERNARDISNKRANCDSANISRSVTAAAEQVAAMQKIVASASFKTLPKELQDTAKARIENPAANYVELAEFLAISKSGLLHRMKRLTSTH